MDNYEYELYHHGVKGMKWGVRKKKEDRYVSRFQAHRNASKAAKESREADIKNGVSSISTIQRHATLAKAKSKIADAEHNQNLHESRQAARKANREAIKERIKSTANKKIEELNKRLTEKRKQELYDIMFPGRNSKQPWDEKPNHKQPWDEKPSKKNTGKI